MIFFFNSLPLQIINNENNENNLKFYPLNLKYDIMKIDEVVKWLEEKKKTIYLNMLQKGD